MSLVVPFVMLLTFFAGIMAATAVFGFIRKSIADAHKHENTMLPFLHIFWIVTIVVFATQAPMFFY